MKEQIGESPEKNTIMQSVRRFFAIFSPGIFVPFDFPPGSMVLFSENRQVLDLLETFSENFRTTEPDFKVLGNFGLNGSRPENFRSIKFDNVLQFKTHHEQATTKEGSETRG